MTSSPCQASTRDLPSAAGTAVLPRPAVLQGRWVRLFTSVDPVVDATVALLPIFALTLLGDATYTSLMALLRGAGKQKARAAGRRGERASRAVQDKAEQGHGKGAGVLDSTVRVVAPPLHLWQAVNSRRQPPR